MIDPPYAVNLTQGSGNHGAHDRPSVSLASWKWSHVSHYMVVTLFIITSGLCKLAFHKAHWLSSRIPESCILIIIGVGFGAVLNAVDRCQPEDECSQGQVLNDFPEFTPDLFFYLLLPPIILESAYSLHNRVFMENLRTIILYAVFGTIINFLLIGAFLIILHHIGWMGSADVYMRHYIGNDVINYTDEGRTVFSDMTGIQILLFASLISAVDPVAVLAIFSEVGVNPDLYFLVFGESLLNDGVAVVIYNMMIVFADMEAENIPISTQNIMIGIGSFFTISLGGLLVGIVMGLVTALITRTTGDIEVLEPLSVFCCAYLSYLFADLFGWSGIISLIGCGIVQAHYSFKNISANSLSTIKYFVKMLSSTCDCIIFLYLGMALLGDQTWHTGFICWSLVLVFVIRFACTFLQTWFVNLFRYGSAKIDYEEQFVMAYGGLRGAVGFSLVKLIPVRTVPAAGLFVTTTLAVIMATVFIQGGTIKWLVQILDISKAAVEQLTLMEEINNKMFDHIMSGIEIISGRYGHNYIYTSLHNLDKKHFKRWLCVPNYDQRMKKVFEEQVLSDHLTNLYGSSAVLPGSKPSDDLGADNKGFEPSSPEETPDSVRRKSFILKEKQAEIFIPTDTSVKMTARDRAVFTSALKREPAKIFPQVFNKDLLHGRNLNFLEEAMMEKKERSARLRELSLMRYAKRRGRRASSFGDSPFDCMFGSEFPVIEEGEEDQAYSKSDFMSGNRRNSVEFRSLNSLNYKPSAGYMNILSSFRSKSSHERQNSGEYKDMDITRFELGNDESLGGIDNNVSFHEEDENEENQNTSSES